MRTTEHLTVNISCVNLVQNRIPNPVDLDLDFICNMTSSLSDNVSRIVYEISQRKVTMTRSIISSEKTAMGNL